MSIVFRDFGTAYLAAPLAVGGLTITVDSPASLPILQQGEYFYLVLQKYSDRSYVEIVKVTATAGNTFTIQRGQAGTSIRAFAVGDYAELRLTVDGLTEYITQNIATKMDKSGGGDFSGLYRFLNPNTSRIDVVRTSDNVAASLVVDFSASEGHRTIIGGTTGSNVTTPSILLRPNGYGNGTGQVKIDSNGLVDVVGLNVRGQQCTDDGSVVRYGHLSNYVPTVRKVNGHALSADFSITADEVFSAGATVNQRAVFQASDLQYKQADGAYGLRLAVSAAIAYLQGGKTDSTLDDQKLYLSGWLGNPLSAFKIYADAVLIHRKSGVDYKIFDEANKPTIGDVAGLSGALLQAGSNPVLSTAWVQLRTAMWNGYTAADGQLLKRADYPDAWAAIQAGKVPVVSDADWLADPLKRGSFTAGDGSTTFRIPDYNGKYVGSIGRTFFGGDGVNAASANGLIQVDAIRNITGSFGGSSATLFHAVSPLHTAGAMTTVGVVTQFRAAAEAAEAGGAVLFDASRVVPTAADNHPVNVTGCWAVKLFGAVHNAGSIDAAALATQLAEAQSRVYALEGGRAFGHAYGLVAKLYAAETQEFVKFQTTALIKRKISIPDNESFVITSISSNLFRVTAEIALNDKNWRQMPQISALLIRSGAVISERLFLFAYTPTSGSTDQANAYQTISGSAYFYALQIGDIIKFKLQASNGASVSLYAVGALTVEEV